LVAAVVFLGGSAAKVDVVAVAVNVFALLQQ
jgi:hypothetical protein